MNNRGRTPVRPLWVSRLIAFLARFAPRKRSAIARRARGSHHPRFTSVKDYNIFQPAESFRARGRNGDFSEGSPELSAWLRGSSRRIMNLQPLGQEETSRTVELRRQIERLERRDLHLWLIGLAVIVILSLGYAALVVPNLVWHVNIFANEEHYIPQLFIGFIVLIILFEIYTLQRRRAFQRTRDEMVHELVRHEAAEKLALVDPLTEVFNRRYLDQLLAKEVNRADRHETPIAFLMLDVRGFKSFNTRVGHRKGDHLLGEVAQLLKRAFRASDSVVRTGADDFLVVMPDTDEASGERALSRLASQVEAWNHAHAEEGFPLVFDSGLAVYAKGADVAQVLESATQKLDQAKPA